MLSQTSWKTTLIGCILAIAVAIEPLISTGTFDWKQVVIAALIAALSFVMKDSDVTGGTRSNNEVGK
jgi:hypothetical protein